VYVLKNILETARQNQEQRTLTKLNYSNTREGLPTLYVKRCFY
jgi:hypothetical protein